MISSRIFVIIVAILALTAGCLGGGGGDGSGDADAGAPGDAPASGSSSSGSGGGEEAAASAADDALVVSSDAEQALRKSGSFTSVWRYSGIDESGVESEVSYTYYADLVGERAFFTIGSSQDGQKTDGGIETFSAAGVTYSRYGSADEAFYQQQDTGVDVVSDALSRATIYNTDTSDFRYEGTETFDGVTVKRYELSQTDSAFWTAQAAAASSESDFEFTEFRYVVLVDGNGLARYESWTFSGKTADGKTLSGTWEYSLTGVGSTTVDEPEWLEEAESQIEAQSGN